jgi:hypothetical protein
MERPPRAGDEPQAAPPRLAAWLPAAIAALLAPGFLVKVKDYDVWWHMATGRWIVQHGRLPTTDPFTYTMQGRPWHLVNGLADLVFYGVYRLGAEPGLVLLKVGFAFVTLTLVGLCLREVRASRGGLLGLVIAIAVLLQYRYTLDRPLIMGAALLAACQLAALRSHRRRDRSHLFFLVALPLWPLVHATALLGAAQIGALLVAALVAQRTMGDTPTPPAQRSHLRSVAATFAACAALTVALPWWRDAYAVASSLTGGATATLFTGEWSTGAEAASGRVGHWALIAVALAGGIRRFREDASLLLLTLVAAAISFRFGRNAYEGVILAAPACACALEDAAARLRAGGTALLAGALAPVAATAMAVAQLVAAPLRTLGGPFGFGVDERLFPYDTLVTLRKLPVHRLFNGFPIGGFLIWQDSPYGVYCDGRTVALYTEADVQRLFLPMMDSAALTRTADAWDAVYGLNENRSPPYQRMMISPDWVPLHLGLGTTLFVRATHLAELPAGVRPLHLVRFSGDARWTAGWYDGIVKDPRLRAQLADEFAAAATLSPESPTLVDILGAVEALDPRYAGALAETLARARGGS